MVGAVHQHYMPHIAAHQDPGCAICCVAEQSMTVCPTSRLVTFPAARSLQCISLQCSVTREEGLASSRPGVAFLATLPLQIEFFAVQCGKEGMAGMDCFQ